MMKKNIYITVLIINFLMLSISAFSQQHSFSIGVDPANAIYGSSVNDPALNYILKYTYNNNYYGVWANDEVGLFYESFEELRFENYGILFNKVMYPKFRHTEVAFGFEGSAIHRWLQIAKQGQKKHSYFWSYGFNLEARLNLGDDWRISLQGNLKRRTDIELWRYSNYILISYRF